MINIFFVLIKNLKMNINSTKTEQAELIFNCYIYTSLSSIGIIALAISLFILFNKQYKENVYNYIRMDVLFSLLTITFYAFRAIYYCPNTYGIYINCGLHIMSTYFRNVFDLMAIMFTIISSIECYSSLKNPLGNNLLSKISYKLVTSVVLVMSSSLFLYRLFEYDIRSELNRSNHTLYLLKKTNFTKSSTYTFNRMMSFVISNGITLFALIFTSILIFLTTRNKIDVKPSEINHQVRLLIYANSLNAIIARTPLLITLFLDFAFVSNRDVFNIISMIGLTLLCLSYSIKFLLFYHVNNIFRTLFHYYTLIAYDYFKYKLSLN